MVHTHNVVGGHNLGYLTGDSGLSQTSTEFQQQYQLFPDWHIECSECCVTYLTQIRHYTIQIGVTKVLFSTQTLATQNCSLKGKGGPNGKHGQITSNPNLNLGIPLNRTLCSGRTYQLYHPNVVQPILTLGLPVSARVESISVKLLRRYEMNVAYLSFADAALLELYFENQERNSYLGVCVWPQPELEPKVVDTKEIEKKLGDVGLNK